MYDAREPRPALMSLPILAEDGVYMRVYVIAAEGRLRGAFDGVDEDVVIVSSRLVHGKTP